MSYEFDRFNPSPEFVAQILKEDEEKILQPPMPWRLDIASRILVETVTHLPKSEYNKATTETRILLIDEIAKNGAKMALFYADALIKAHEETKDSVR